ncbi:YlbE-like family protein [Tannockella kyphosi]|uniref:YlbE-like family protein n=1 Tax=Tannockella kyphosi TaxID=2899121 RepID=UPI002011129E|nr:YlbE-like family protein [Tannockella kyphosi]
MNDSLALYMQENPSWYITLSRYPEKKKELEKKFKIETKETMESKLDKMSMILSMMEMLL